MTKHKKLTRPVAFLLAFLMILGSMVIPGYSPTVTETNADELKEREAPVISNVTDSELPFVSTEEYIRSHLNAEKIPNAGDLRLVGAIRTKHTLGKKSAMAEDESLYSMMSEINDKAMEKFLKISPDFDNVYDAGNETYYVSLVNRALGQKGAEVRDIIYARDNMAGEVVTGPWYDKESGILYIPKDVYDKEGAEVKLQAQLLYALDDGVKTQKEISLSVNGKSKVIHTTDENIRVTFPLVSKEEKEDVGFRHLVVKNNGVPVPEESIYYNKDSGRMTLLLDPSILQNIEVTYQKDGLLDKIANVFAPKVTADSFDSLPSANATAFKLSKEASRLLKNGTLASTYYQGYAKGMQYNWKDTAGVQRFGFQIKGTGLNDKDSRIMNYVVHGTPIPHDYEIYRGSANSGAANIWALWLTGRWWYDAEPGDTSQTAGLEMLRDTYSGQPLFAPGAIDNGTYDNVSQIVRLFCSHIAMSAGDGNGTAINNKPKAVKTYAKTVESKYDPNGASYILLAITTQSYNGQSMNGLIKFYVEPVVDDVYVAIKKVDPEGRPLAGADIGCYRWYSDAWEGRNPIEVKTTGEDGFAIFGPLPDITPDAPNNAYYLREKSTPSADYKLNPAIYSVYPDPKVNNAGGDKAKRAENLVNEYANGTLRLSGKFVPYGEEQLKVSGITFGVYSDAALKNRVATITSNSSAPTDITLPVGKYYVKEDETQPIPVDVSDKVWEVSVAGKQVTQIDAGNIVENTFPFTDVSFTKKDVGGQEISYGGKNIFSQSIFKLKAHNISALFKGRVKSGYWSVAGDDSVPSEYSPDTDGVVLINRLPPGSYELIETTTGRNLPVNPGSIKFDIVTETVNGRHIAKVANVVNTTANSAANLANERRNPYGAENLTVSSEMANDKQGFYNYLTEGFVTITKLDNENKLPMQGVSFTIHGLDDTAFEETKVTGEDGKLNFGPLKMGRYEIYESKVPDGYEPSSFRQTFEVIPWDTNTFAYTVTNDATRVEIPLQKKDVEGKEQNPAAFDGIVFEAVANSQVRDKYVKNIPNRVFTATVKDGKAVFENLPLGVYTITEKSIPEEVAKIYSGNKNAKIVVDATDKENIHVTENGNNTIALSLEDLNANYGKLASSKKAKSALNAAEVVFANRPLYGVIRLKKERDTTGEALKGAIFRISGGPANYFDKTYTTNEAGEILSDPLRVGDYTVTEVQPAPGFAFVNGEVHTYKIHVSANTTAEEVTENHAQYKLVKNTRVTSPPITLTKKSITGENIGEATLAGAKFELKVKSLHYLGLQNEVQPGEVVGTYTADEQGNLTILDALPSGEYELRETEAPKGMTLNPNKISFAIDWDKSGTSPVKDIRIDYGQNETAIRDRLQTLRATLTEVFNNCYGQKDWSDEELGLVAEVHPADEKNKVDFMERVMLGRVEVEKVYNAREDGKVPEEGVTFGVYQADGYSLDGLKNPTTEPVTTFLTGKMGRGASKYLPYGKYILHQETSLHADIDKIEDIPFEIAEDGKILTFAPVNEHAAMRLRIVKKDEDTGKTILQSGVTFELHAARDIIDPMTGKTLYPKDGLVSFKVGSNLVSQLTTNNEGYTDSFDKILSGDYYLKEIKGPEGYFVDKDAKYLVTIPNETELLNGVVNTIEVTILGEKENMVGVDVENAPQYGELTLQKIAEQLTGWEAQTKKVTAQEEERIEDVETTIPRAHHKLVLESTTLKDVEEQKETREMKEEVRYILSRDGKEVARMSEEEFAKAEALSKAALEKVAQGANLEDGVSVTEIVDGQSVETIVTKKMVKVEGGISYETVVVKKPVTVTETVETGEDGTFRREVGAGSYKIYDADKTYQSLSVKEGETGEIFVSLEPEVKKEQKYVAGEIKEKAFDIFRPVYEKLPLAGAKFELIAEEDIASYDKQTVFYQKDEKVLFAKEDIEKDGKIIYKKGEAISAPVLDEETIREKTIPYMETGSIAETKALRIPLGKYRLVEIFAPKGFQVNETVNHFEFTPQNQEIRIVKAEPLTVENERQHVTFNAEKVLAERKHPEGQKVENIVFGLFTKEEVQGLEKDKMIDVKNPDKDGKVTFEDVPAGKFYIKEISTLNGYTLRDDEYEIISDYAKDLNHDIVEKLDEPIHNDQTSYKLTVVKVDTVTGEKLPGVRFKLWKVGQDGEKILVKNGDEEVWVTNEEGKIVAEGLDEGTYRWEEVGVLPGYIEENKTIQIAVNEKSNIKVTIGNNPSEMSFAKIDADTGNPVAGATLSLQNEDGSPVFLNEKNYVAKEGKKATWETTDSAFIIRGLVVGKTYKLVEEKAPAGYVTASPVVFTVDNKVGLQLQTIENRYTNIRIVKKDWSSGTPVEDATIEVREVLPDGKLAGVFVDKLTGKEARWTTGKGLEEGYIVRGLEVGKEYAFVETKVPNGYLAPVSDTRFVVADSFDTQKVVVLNEPVPEVGTTLAYEDGAKENLPEENVKLTDVVSLEKLVVGETYKVKGKLVNSKNTDLVYAENEVDVVATDTSMTVEIPFTVNAKDLAGNNLVAFEYLFRYGRNFEDGPIAKHEEKDDENQTVYVPKIGTTASDVLDGEKDALAQGEVTIKDVLHFENLKPGETYKANGVLMDKETGKELLVDGKMVTAEKTFTAPESGIGDVTLFFTFRADGLDGRTLVAFEKVVNGAGKLIAKHEDIEDKDQTVLVPKISTLALAVDKTKEIPLEQGEITITDTVSFENLIVGNTYTAKGTLMDKTTGRALLIDGKEVLSEKTFTAEVSNGTVTLDFTINPKGLDGKELVVFEKLLNHTGKPVGIHEDIEDKGQTVYVPKIHTNAAITGADEADEKKMMTITDKVTYTNLIVGKEYEVTGTLMVNDGKDGTPLLVDGKEVTAKVTFTPQEQNGEVTLTFEVPMDVVVGKTIVAFEEVSREGKPIVFHKDIHDKDQTVYIPKIGTTANISDGEKEADPISHVTILDKVRYQNLTPGKEYRLEGVLMDKETGDVLFVDGKSVTGTAKFTPLSPSGEVTISFTLDATNLKGKKLVVFESLFFEEELMATHKDLEDEGQTVSITNPKVQTKAEFDDKMKEANPLETLTLIDHVSCQGLIIGKEYTVEGVLMDKETGKELLVDGERVTAKKTFVAEKKDGEVEITFFVPAKTLRGKTLVVFEDLLREGEVIAFHKDIEDKEQTVSVSNPKVGTKANFSDNTKTQMASQKMTIVDRFSYEGLVAGKNYIVRGILMDKTTGKPLLVQGKEVHAEKEFLATASSGFVTLDFVFNGMELGGRDVVVFEKLYEIVPSEDGGRFEKFVDSHEDINDEGQTVTITKRPMPKGTPTNDISSMNGSLLPFGLVTVAAVCAATVAMEGFFDQRATRAMEGFFDQRATRAMEGFFDQRATRAMKNKKKEEEA